MSLVGDRVRQSQQPFQQAVVAGGGLVRLFPSGKVGDPEQQFPLRGGKACRRGTIRNVSCRSCAVSLFTMGDGGNCIPGLFPLLQPLLDQLVKLPLCVLGVEPLDKIPGLFLKSAVGVIPKRVRCAIP